MYNKEKSFEFNIPIEKNIFYDNDFGSFRFTERNVKRFDASTNTELLRFSLLYQRYY